jgi:hypothetical protein
MLNYFYVIKFLNDFQEIKAFINSNVPDKFNTNASSLGSITLWSKFEAFATDLKLKEIGKFYQIIHWLIKLRNEGSHRNTLADNKEEETLMEAEVRGFFGYVDFKRFTTVETNTYNKVQYILFKRKKDFHLVESNLGYFKEAVRIQLI